MAIHNTTTTFESFCGSVGLSDEQTLSFVGRLNQATNNTSSSGAMLQDACQVAQIALGIEKVNLSPLNQTVVEENW